MRNPSIRSGITAFLAAVAMALFASSAFAVLKISVMPNGTNATPLPNAWDSRPYTWPGNNLELFGRVNAYDGGKALSYTWNFGAGEGSSSGAVASQSNIAASHAYGATGTFIATLTVTDVPAGGTETASATVFIDVVGDSPTVRKNLAIQRALKYLYMNRQSTTVNSCPAYYWSTTDTTGDTGLAVLAFEDYNHRASNDPDKDIYADTVGKGLNYIEYLLRRTGAANTPNSDSDLNGNGFKMYETNNNAYRQGILAMAIANTKEPGRVSTCGYSGHSLGMSYQTILEDMVDYIAYMQEERTGYSGRGGWRYGPNYGSSDNSVSQWPVLGLAAASQAPWNISAPAWMIGLMPIWSNYSQTAATGAFGYTSSNYWDNVAKTGSGVIQQKYSGISGAPLTNAINYIGNNWCATSYDYGNLGDHYAMYAAKKGLQYAGITNLTVPVACRAAGTVNWQSEYDTWYVNNKVDNGTNGYYWPGSVRIGAGRTTAAFALLVMAKGLAESPPIADAGPAQEVPAGVPVAFDGSGSYHSDPTKSIVSYEWDFDYNGINFDVDAVGPTPTKAAGYTLPVGVPTKVYTVALKVTDNNVPPLTGNNTTTVTVSNGNQAPVANAGGPYGGPVGANITLNGTGSSDANRAGGPNPIPNPLMPSGFDEIVSYEWDLDGDGQFDDATGPSPVVNFGSFIGTKTISLKVTDSFGASGVQSSSATTIAFSDVRPLCYVPTQNVYNPITKKWTKAWKLKLQNTGTGDASAISAVLTSVPLGVTVLDGNLAWTGILPAGGTLLSTDTFSYRHGSPAPDIAAMTWNIELTDNFGVQHRILNIPQGSGICAP